MHTATSRFEGLVLLRAGSEAPPLFMAHGLGGSAQQICDLGTNLRTSHAVYCIQAPGSDGVAEPLDRIENLARYHLTSIRSLQPTGPYLLAGYSLGGLVALEIAQHLCSEGESIALLAMIDSYPHSSQISIVQRLRLKIRLAQQRLVRAVRPRLRRPDPMQQATASEPNPDLSAMAHVHASSHRAWRRYQPRFYPGKIDFFRAEISTEFPDDPTAIWSGLAKEFECVTVPGDHKGIITTNVAQLGLAISHHLMGAVNQR